MGWRRSRNQFSQRSSEIRRDAYTFVSKLAPLILSEPLGLRQSLRIFVFLIALSDHSRRLFSKLLKLQAHP